MYSRKNQDSLFRINDVIKRDLINSQRVLKKIDQNHESEGKLDSIDKQSRSQLFISIRDKIGFSETIISQDDLSNHEIEVILEQWLIRLRYHRIILLFNENQTDSRARYEFISSVFFNMELPSHPHEMHFCFIYDKIGGTEHTGNPDIYINEVIEPLLNKDRINVFKQLNKRVRLNDFDNLSEPELHYVIDRYQQRFEKIINKSVFLDSKKLLNNRLIFVGRHETGYFQDDNCNIARGSWRIEMIPSEGRWLVVDIQIEGVDF